MVDNILEEKRYHNTHQIALFKTNSHGNIHKPPLVEARGKSSFF